MTFESAKLLALQQSLSNGTSAMPIHVSRSCPKLFKFLCGPTQRERSIGPRDQVGRKASVNIIVANIALVRTFQRP